jgi:hypothetical protein
MKPALHIFKKDTRRLWPGVAISLAVLAMLARADRWRADSMIGSTEGWLNLLLPLAWACLTGLSVLAEPLTGNRHFWLTRPYRRPALLAAKLLFALLFIHVPVLLADWYILAARGFPPFENLLPLAGKQVMLAAAVTLPAMALAALAGGFTPMLPRGGGAAILAAGGPFPTLPSLQRPEDYLRADIVASMVAVGAIAILGVQYRRRRPFTGRAVALVTAFTAGALFGYVPDTFDDRLRAALHPAAALGLHMDASPPMIPPHGVGATGDSRSRSCLPDSAGVAHHTGPATSLTAPERAHRPEHHSRAHRITLGTKRNFCWMRHCIAFPAIFESSAHARPRFDRRLYERLGNQHARASGRIPVSFYCLYETAWMPMYGQWSRPLWALFDLEERNPCPEGMIKVPCESPSTLPQVTRVTLPSQGSGANGTGDVRNSATPERPQWAWLTVGSSEDLLQHLGSPDAAVPVLHGSATEHPTKRRLPSPRDPDGYTVVDFEFPTWHFMRTIGCGLNRTLVKADSKKKKNMGRR